MGDILTIDKMPWIINSVSRRAKELGGLLAGKSIGGFSRFLTVNVIKGIISERLEGVRADQLWTQITDGVDPSEVWNSEDGTNLPDGTANVMQSVNRFVDVKGNLHALDDLLEERGGEIVLLAVRDVRPDLYEVLINTPGGQSMIWHGARKLQGELRELAEVELG